VMKKNLQKIIDQQTVFAEALDSIKSDSMNPKQNTQPSAIGNQIEDLRAQVKNLKTTIEREYIRKSESTTNLVNELAKSLNLVKGAAVAARQDQEMIQRDLLNQQQAIAATVEKGGFGFWWIFFVFQLFSGFGYMYWRKMRDDNKKKLY